MHSPILKYYLPSPLSLKLRLHISNLSLEKILLEAPLRDGLECLFYADTQATDPHLVGLSELLAPKEASFQLEFSSLEFSFLTLLCCMHRLVSLPASYVQLHVHYLKELLF